MPYERSRYKRLTQVMAGGHGVAFEGLLEATPGKYSHVLAERRGCIRFTLTNKMLRGEAVSLEGTYGCLVPAAQSGLTPTSSAASGDALISDF